MDAFVQLALIEKAKRVFAADAGVLLSFPLLAPMGFTATELAALNAPATAAEYAAAGEFARTVNFLPTDMVATATERMLWDVYRDVLSRAEVGDGARGGDQDLAAASVLYEVAPDGLRIESEALKRYRQYRDAWFVAREDYAAHKLSGELSQDLVERQQWADVDEPALRAALDAAASAWESLGGRATIEVALQAERDAAVRDPRRRWAEWNQAFNPDIDMITEAGGGQYAPTGFSPRNFVDQDWLTFVLSASEMRVLVEEAPEALKRVLDDDAGSGIERVSFDYRSVALVRPWFRAEVLTSGIWRSSDPDLQLSDGGDPATGACPAYASACVFVRNVAVTEQGASVGTISPDLRFTLDAARLTVRRNLVVDPGIASRLARLMVQPEAPGPAPAVAPIAFRALERNSFLQLAAPQQDAPAIAPSLRRSLKLSDIVFVDRIGRDVFGTAGLEPAPPSPPPPPASRARRDLTSRLYLQAAASGAGSGTGPGLEEGRAPLPLAVGPYVRLTHK